MKPKPGPDAKYRVRLHSQALTHIDKQGRPTWGKLTAALEVSKGTAAVMAAAAKAKTNAHLRGSIEVELVP